MERRLAAILAADVVGYSRLMEQDEVDTLVLLKARRKDVLEPLVAKHHGRVFKVTGDGVLVEFASAVNAVLCAIDLQQAMAAANQDQPEDRRIVLRIGVNLGDVMVEGRDLYGDGVNIAARLEGIAEPGAVLVSGTAYDQIKNKIKASFDDIGAQVLKNIAEPVRAYRVVGATSAAIKSPKTTTNKPSIAVLPFANMSSDPAQEYFADGVTEDIITGLSLFRELVVIARTSSFSYKGRAVPIATIARELGVAYVLEGSVRRAGNHVRITAQLIEAASGEHLWAQRYDRDSTDVFALQDEISDSVVGALAGRLGHITIERACRQQPESLTALDLFLQGRAQVHLYNPVSLAKARTLLEAAVSASPNYAAAYAWLAEVHWALWWTGWTCDPTDSFARAAELADRAISLDERDPHAQLEKGQILLHLRRFEEARFHLDRAAELNRFDPDVIMLQAYWALFAGDHDLSAAKMQTVTRLDPLGHYGLIFGMIHYTHRDYQQAIVNLKRVRGEFPSTHAWLAACHAMIGDRSAASAAAEIYIAAATAAAKTAGGAAPSSWREFLKERHPFRTDGEMKHFLDGLAQAGVP